jgi:hypothetical protein
MQANIGYSLTSTRSTIQTQLDLGNWLIQAAGPTGIGLTRITLGADDATAFVTFVKGGRISGRMITDGGSLPVTAAPSIVAQPVERGIRPGNPGRLKTDGTFEVANLIGRRRLDVSGLPQGWALKAILSADDRNLADEAIDFAGTEDVRDVRVIVTSHHSELTGTIAGDATQIVSDWSVLVFAEDRERLHNSRRWARWTRPDLRGRFLADDLLPGTYLAVAVDDVDDTQWQNEDYLEQFRARAARITLGDGETKSIVLEAPPR